MLWQGLEISRERVLGPGTIGIEGAGVFCGRLNGRRRSGTGVERSSGSLDTLGLWSWKDCRKSHRRRASSPPSPTQRDRNAQLSPAFFSTC